MDAGPSSHIALALPALVDGGMMTELWKRGMPEDATVPQWVAEHPDEVTAVQRAYLDAGAAILVTPNFGGNRPMLSAVGLGEETIALNRHVAELTRRNAQGRALVAGGLSPAGLTLPPFGEHSFEYMVSVYREQAAAMEDLVDVFWIESSTELPEARAAALAIRSVTDKPFFATFSCDGEGRLHGSGTDVLAALIVMQGLGASAFGIGCTPAQVVAEQLERLAPYAMVPLIAKPCGPANLAQELTALATAGARILGGCCLTGPEEIAALGNAISALGFSELEVPYYTADPDVIPCASSHEARFLTPDVDVGEPVECKGDMVADILRAEQEQNAGAIKIAIRDEEDLLAFAENQYAVREALCIEAEEPELMEGALRVYQGRAFYDGLAGLAQADLERFHNQYGLVLL